MRPGPRIAVVCALLTIALCSQARAADTLSVFVDNPSIALGAVTTFAAHTQTDADFKGGHAEFKYRGADTDCAASPVADPGDVATDGPIAVGAGPGMADVGGQQLQLNVGNWVLCGWLIDDSTGAVVASGSAGVQVIPYQGNLSLSVKKLSAGYQLVLAYSTSEAARLYVSIQRSSCSRFTSHIPKKALLATPRGGRLVGGDGGLGKTIARNLLTPGKWNVCAWLVADDGRVGPAVKTFSVPQARKRRGARAAG